MSDADLAHVDAHPFTPALLQVSAFLDLHATLPSLDHTFVFNLSILDF